MIDAVQLWNPDDWELFAFGLLQSRHGALNIHKIPAAHKGDLGIDYYCPKEGVVYQCYAAQEPIDIATRADRQKKKITTDLGMLVSKAAEVSQLFLGKSVKHWVLLAPLHDSKEVNLHCASKTTQIRNKNYNHLDSNFEVTIQDQNSFPLGVIATGVAAIKNVALSVPIPTPEELSQWEVGSRDLLANANRKLIKRTSPGGLQEAVSEAVKLFLQSNAILDRLRTGAPELHEKIMTTIAQQSRRLGFAGPQGGPEPGQILHTEIDNLIAAIKSSVPNLSNENASQIAMGTVSEWILRCPLDFPSDA